MKIWSNILSKIENLIVNFHHKCWTKSGKFGQKIESYFVQDYRVSKVLWKSENLYIFFVFSFLGRFCGLREYLQITVFRLFRSSKVDYGNMALVKILELDLNQKIMAGNWSSNSKFLYIKMFYNRSNWKYMISSRWETRLEPRLFWLITTEKNKFVFQILEVYFLLINSVTFRFANF